MKKLFTAALCVLAAMLAFAACAKKDAAAPETEDKKADDIRTEDAAAPEVKEENLVGNWVAKINAAEMVNEAAQMEGFFDTFNFLFKFDFTDSTLTMNVELDPESVDAFGEKMIEFAKEQLGEMAEGLSDEEIAEMLDLETLKQDLADQFGSLEEEAGEYKVKDGKIYIVENGEIDENCYMTYEFKDGKLYINEISASEAIDEQFLSFLPFVFERA